MFHGPATINAYVPDVAAAAEWYADVFGVHPYFRREVGGHLAYVEFRVGGEETEFGLVDARFAPFPAGAGGVIVYWHTDDLAGTLARLLEAGAAPLLPVTEQGEGFVTASVVDPFGTVLGIMHNAHYAQRHA